MTENSKKFLNDIEIDLLIEEIKEAANEAIEQAAGEAARAAFLLSLERETAALKEAAHQQAEALRWRGETEIHLKAIALAKRAGIRNSVMTGIVCFASGLIFGFLINN